MAKRTRNVVSILDRMVGDDPEMQLMVAEEMVNVRIGQAVYDVRTGAGLTQSQLAKLVGTTQPVIARLEDADYRGHSLNMLVRIAFALNKELDVRFVDKPRRTGKRIRALT
jgi:predicted XRE-type DNA-binding protein